MDPKLPTTRWATCKMIRVSARAVWFSMSAIIFFKHCLAPIRFSWLYGFVYDDLGRRRYWGANSTSETYVDDGQDVAFMAGSGAHSYNVFQGLDLDDYFAIAVDSNSAQSVLHDGLGSTTGTVNFSGQTTGTNQYSPFGATSSTGSPGAGPFQYTERELDPTGLYYMRNRYYSFGLQRFVFVWFCRGRSESFFVCRQFTNQPRRSSWPFRNLRGSRQRQRTGRQFSTKIWS